MKGFYLLLTSPGQPLKNPQFFSAMCVRPMEPEGNEEPARSEEPAGGDEADEAA